MKKTVLSFAFLTLLAVSISVANAQPTMAPASPMTAKPAVMSSAKPVVKKTVAKPAAKVEAMKAAATDAKPADMKPEEKKADEAMKAEEKTTMEAAPEEKKEEKKKKMSTGELMELIFQILAGIVSLVFTILGPLGYMKWAKDNRWKKVQGFLDLGFDAVEGLVKGTKNEVDNKLLEFFKRVNTMLAEQGEPELSEGEKKAAAEIAANKALAEKKG